MNSTVSLNNHIEREKIYASVRPALMKNIRESSKIMNKVIRGFFDSPIHVHKMFEYLTGVSNLKEIITENLEGEVKKMEKVLIKKDNSYIDKLERMRNVAQTDFHGNEIFKYVSVIRWTVKTFDKDEKSLLLFEHEEIVTDGPFLRVIESEDSR